MKFGSNTNNNLVFSQIIKIIIRVVKTDSVKNRATPLEDENFLITSNRATLLPENENFLTNIHEGSD